MIEEDDENFGPLLDDVDMATLIEEDVDSESGSHNGWRGVKYRIPPCIYKEKNYGDTGETRDPRGSAKQQIIARRTNRFYNNCLVVELSGILNRR